MGQIAEERMKILFNLAEKRFHGEKDLSDRYVEIARKIGMRTNTPLPGKYRKKFCQECSSYLKPGKNCKVTVDAGRGIKIVTCEECGKVDRHGLKEK